MVAICSVNKAILMGIMLDYVTTLIDIYVNNKEIEQKVSDWNDNKLIPYGLINKEDFSKLGNHVFVSNVVLSYPANTSIEDASEILPVDSDCYEFAIDSCTTFHICKHKELFVNEIMESDDLYVQGIGGKIKVTGYGTIKLRVVDNEGQKHNLLISNTLFVPESPTNLISPQKWSINCNDEVGTG